MVGKELAMLTGKVVFISGTERQKDGKFYYNANLELEGGMLLQNVSTDLDCLNKMFKYRPYLAKFDVSVYNGATRLKLVDALPDEQQTKASK